MNTKSQRKSSTKNKANINIWKEYRSNKNKIKTFLKGGNRTTVNPV